MNLLIFCDEMTGVQRFRDQMYLEMSLPENRSVRAVKCVKEGYPTSEPPCPDTGANPNE